MSQAAALRLALVGNPNCGKTALFNRLTGARQKTANYAGVTVERKEGRFTSASGRAYHVVDLPGTYSLHPLTPDEAITCEVLSGARRGEAPSDVLVLVADATNLRLGLRLVLEVVRLGRPAILALNMIDVARRRGFVIDVAKLEAGLGIPVVETVATEAGGAARLVEKLEAIAAREPAMFAAHAPASAAPHDVAKEVRRILRVAVQREGDVGELAARIDAVVLHPVIGYVLLATLLFLVFQAVFSWSKAPMDLIKWGVDALGRAAQAALPAGMLRSLLVDGVLSGVGSVLVFLPQIMILFLFILALEDSGYLPRAAFLLDRLMGTVGLSGRAFIPLLSSFACAIPGILATRTIHNPRDRLATIMIAPLMTCSARLPVYALVIGAFIPDRSAGPFNLRGLVLFALYIAGIVSAMAVALVLKHTLDKGRYQPLMMQLPSYHWPNLRNLAIGLWDRGTMFVTRVGTIILAMMVLVWFLSSFPAAPSGWGGSAIEYSIAGRLGHWLQPLFAPVGFNWQIAIALIPGMAAREVAVGALGTVYALAQAGDQLAPTLSTVIAASWSLPTALSLLAWYVFAPQCVSTLSVVRRETGSWKPVAALAGYMFALAYAGSFATYQAGRALLGGA